MTTATFYPVDDVALPQHVRNMGAMTTLATTYGLILIRFDLSSISSSATATAATIKFYQTSTNTENRTRTGNMYKITDANGDWIEGSGTFSYTAVEGDPTGYAKQADGSGGVKVAWAGSNMLGTAGTDYINTALIDTFSINDTNVVGYKYTNTFNSAGLAVLQDWFGDVTNNGFKLAFSSNCNMNLGSSENANESYRPVLTVTYTAGGAFPNNTYIMQG